MNRSSLCSTLALSAGALLAYVGITLAANRPAMNFEDYALGGLTTSIFPTVDKFPIHISDAKDFPGLVDGWQERGRRPVALWLGNSQLHAINQADGEALPASYHVFSAFNRQDVDVLTWSVPNANVQEHYAIFEHARSHIPSMEILLLPLVFDDFRESGIRQSLVPLLSDRMTMAKLAETEIGQHLLEAHSIADGGQGGDVSSDGVQESLQGQSEAFLEGWLDDRSEAFASRGQLRGELFTKTYELRNRIFGITSQSVRGIIPGRYVRNREAVAAILEAADHAGIRALVYIVPLRQDIGTPYDAGQYADFKEDMRGLAQRHHASFVNLDALVPGEFWGQMYDMQGDGAGYDFMHFQEGGHLLLAEEIERQIRLLLQEKSGARS